jgi:hypothetical protein
MSQNQADSYLKTLEAMVEKYPTSHMKKLTMALCTNDYLYFLGNMS